MEYQIADRLVATAAATTATCIAATATTVSTAATATTALTVAALVAVVVATATVTAATESGLVVMLVLLLLLLLLLLDRVDNLVGDAQVLDVVAFDVDFWQTHEAVTVGIGLHNLLQSEVHPCIALHKVAVEGLAVLELDQHRLALCGAEEAEGKLQSWLVVAH